MRIRIRFRTSLYILMRIRVYIWWGCGSGCESILPKWCGSLWFRIRIHNTEKHTITENAFSLCAHAHIIKKGVRSWRCLGKSPLGMRRSYRRACALEDVMENLLWACADQLTNPQISRLTSIWYARSWGLFSAGKCSDVQFFSFFLWRACTLSLLHEMLILYPCTIAEGNRLGMTVCVGWTSAWLSFD